MRVLEVREIAHNALLIERQRHRVATVRRIIGSIMQPPQPGQLFCHRYFSGLLKLEDGGAIGSKPFPCTVEWFQNFFPRLAAAIERRISQIGHDMRRSITDAWNRAKDFEPFQPKVQSPRYAGNWYLWKDENQGDDDLAKVYESSQ